MQKPEEPKKQPLAFQRSSVSAVGFNVRRSLDQQHQHQLLEMQIPGPMPYLLDQVLCRGWGSSICVTTRPRVILLFRFENPAPEAQML